jgi:membrane-associated phospholipid phosphatase
MPRARVARGLVVVAASSLTLLLAGEGRAWACEDDGAPFEGYGAPLPWTRLPCNTKAAFTGTNFAALFAGVFVTAELSASGADHEVRVALARHAAYTPFSDATVWAGYVAIPATAGSLYLTGVLARERSLSYAGAAALQSVAVAAASTFALKLLTGRPFPMYGGDPASPARLEHPEWAREWNGPEWGLSAWPSGHTAVAVALASSLTAYYTHSPSLDAWGRSLLMGLVAVAYPVAAAVGWGMLVGEHHWLSDVAFGATMGHTIGWETGRAFGEMHAAAMHRAEPERAHARQAHVRLRASLAPQRGGALFMLAVDP